MGTGDGGSAGDPSGNAQNTNSLLGKILRLDVSTTGTYVIPPTNPFASSAGADEIFAYGLRNPFRFSFDRTAGTLFLGDVGQGAWEEVDIITNGANYGWNVMEGNVCYNATTCNTSGKTLPITVYGHTNGNYSITGGCMYRGTQMPSQAGRYIFGDYGSGRIWSLQQTGPSTWTPTELFVIGSAGTVGLVAFGEDTNGELYAVGISNGTVYRLKDTAGVADFDLYQ
jgi:glucose/arabinose dehydrogenase